MAESDPGGPGCGRLEARQCPPQPTDGLADVRLPHVDAMTAARQHERGRRGGGVHGPAERLVTRPASPRTATCLCAEAKDIGLACASFTDASPARVRRRMSRRSPAPGMRCGRAFLAPIPSLCAWYAVWGVRFPHQLRLACIPVMPASGLSPAGARVGVSNVSEVSRVPDDRVGLLLGGVVPRGRTTSTCTGGPQRRRQDECAYALPGVRQHWQ